MALFGGVTFGGLTQKPLKTRGTLQKNVFFAIRSRIWWTFWALFRVFDKTARPPKVTPSDHGQTPWTSTGRRPTWRV